VGGFVVAAEQDARQRAVICQDCWFWKEMSCALANPVADVCANRRPVRGRVNEQAPVAATVEVTPTPERLQPAARVPFAANAPEATFSIAQVRQAHPAPAPRADQRLELFEQPVARVLPPSFRDIRAGRAAAAMRQPAEVAAVIIPVAEVEAQPALIESSVPGFEQLCERVRLRTAARLSRTVVSGIA